MTTEQQIAWLIANTQATNTIIRALAEANKANPVFVDALHKLKEHRVRSLLNSLVPDAQAAEFEKALRELLPPEVRPTLWP